MSIHFLHTFAHFCTLWTFLNIFLYPLSYSLKNPKGVAPQVLKQVANLPCLQWIYEKDFFLWGNLSVFLQNWWKSLSPKNNILTGTRKQQIVNIFVNLHLLFLSIHSYSLRYCKYCIIPCSFILSQFLHVSCKQLGNYCTYAAVKSKMCQGSGWRLLFGDFLGLIFGNLIFLRTKKTLIFLM